MRGAVDKTERYLISIHSLIFSVVKAYFGSGFSSRAGKKNSCRPRPRARTSAKKYSKLNASKPIALTVRDFDVRPAITVLAIVCDAMRSGGH
jgi:hypothetical protein